MNHFFINHDYIVISHKKRIRRITQTSIYRFHDLMVVDGNRKLRTEKKG
jgi:hypothetical protein